ncbi:hypothetical protein PCE1_003202 [Barthelona sp. PCE]
MTLPDPLSPMAFRSCFTEDYLNSPDDDSDLFQLPEPLSARISNFSLRSPILPVPMTVIEPELTPKRDIRAPPVPQTTRVYRKSRKSVHGTPIATQVDRLKRSLELERKQNKKLMMQLDTAVADRVRELEDAVKDMEKTIKDLKKENLGMDRTIKTQSNELMKNDDFDDFIEKQRLEIEYLTKTNKTLMRERKENASEMEILKGENRAYVRKIDLLEHENEDLAKELELKTQEYLDADEKLIDLENKLNFHISHRKKSIELMDDDLVQKNSDLLLSQHLEIREFDSPVAQPSQPSHQQIEAQSDIEHEFPDIQVTYSPTKIRHI